jgi:hypothetical protein
MEIQAMLRRRILATLALLIACRWGLAAEPAAPTPIPPGQFDAILKLIKPAADESRWKEVPWLLDTIEARRQAAAAGKPILVWYGGGSPPIGAC